MLSNQRIIAFQSREIAADLTADRLLDLIAFRKPSRNGRKDGEINAVFLIELLDQDRLALIKKDRVRLDDRSEHRVFRVALGVNQEFDILGDTSGKRPKRK